MVPLTREYTNQRAGLADVADKHESSIYTRSFYGSQGRTGTIFLDANAELVDTLADKHGIQTLEMRPLSSITLP